VTKSETAAHLRALQADGTLTTLLAKHGAILLRGVPVSNAEDFSELTHALGFAPHEIIGIVVDRPLLAPNVAPANESAPHVLIYNHNESPQVPHAPEYVGFYAHVAAKVGGETPISSSIELFHRAQAEIPDFIDLLAQKGVLSRVTYKPEAQYKGGSTLRDAFGKEWVEGDDEETRKRKVEEQIERYGRGEYTTYEWSTDGSLVLTHRIPALRRHALTGLPTLFTGLAAYLIRARTNPHALVAKQYYGDGTVIEDAYLEKLVEITDNVSGRAYPQG
jgi:hypothetical protein